MSSWESFRHAPITDKPAYFSTKPSGISTAKESNNYLIHQQSKRSYSAMRKTYLADGERFPSQYHTTGHTQDTFGGNNTITEAEGIQAVKILGKLKMKSTLIWSQP